MDIDKRTDKILTLTTLLNDLEESDIPNVGYLTDTEFLETLSDEFQSKINEITERLCELFIVDSRQNREAIDHFNKTSNWIITRGEVDSFGWLSGVLHTKKGRIVYG